MTNMKTLEQAAREAFSNEKSWSEFLSMHRGQIGMLSMPEIEILLSLVLTGERPPLCFDELQIMPSAPIHDTLTAACFRGFEEATT